MRGTKAKQIRRRAAETEENYKKLKRTYLKLLRTHGLGKSASHTHHVASGNKPAKFLGFRKPYNNTSPVYVLHPNKGWETNPELRLNHYKAIGALHRTVKKLKEINNVVTE